jgi:hypothetical protein
MDLTSSSMEGAAADVSQLSSTRPTAPLDRGLIVFQHQPWVRLSAALSSAADC